MRQKGKDGYEYGNKRAKYQVMESSEPAEDSYLQTWKEDYPEEGMKHAAASTNSRNINTLKHNSGCFSPS